MRSSLLHIILLALCLRAEDVVAQGRGSRHSVKPAVPTPDLKATVDKDRILIGEPIHLMLEATFYGDAPITWPAEDSLPHFEWLERHPADSTISTGRRYYRQYLTLTSFDSGRWAIPRLPFLVGTTTFFTDSVPIRVDYTPVDPSKDYRDPALFERERREIFAKNWMLFSWSGRLREPGDYVTGAVAGYPVFAMRDDEGRVRAFHNVCRHRGAQLLSEPSGHCAIASYRPYSLVSPTADAASAAAANERVLAERAVSLSPPTACSQAIQVPPSAVCVANTCQAAQPQ